MNKNTEVKTELNGVMSADSIFSQASNPLAMKAGSSVKSISEYRQTVSRHKYDRDALELAEVVRILNNMAPIRMPVYNFNVDEINGEHYYKPDGTLLLIREYDSDVIRDYYCAKDSTSTIDRILEHDKYTGRLRAKIEPAKRSGSRIKVNIAIFDEKINNKYTIIQLSEDGIVNNFSEYSGRGQSFQTLFRNIHTFKPARYLEGRETKENGFQMVDCIFGENGEIARIKRYNKNKEVKIDYTSGNKNITVKSQN